jgi:hypothetical protein
MPARMGVEEFVYPVRFKSAVAFSWGVLLLIADRRPAERKWVLPPTSVGVFLLGIAVVYAGLAGLIPARQLFVSSAAVVLVLALLLYTVYTTRQA